MVTLAEAVRAAYHDQVKRYHPDRLAGLDLPTSGHVELRGTNLSSLDEDGRARVRADHVGFVFQSFHLVPSLNALENVMLPLELGGHADARAAAREFGRHQGRGAVRHGIQEQVVVDLVADDENIFFLTDLCQFL